ncbi:hypothetical protein Rsub_00039 [Raphidocelis subcapitata]|uniref:Small ribosomal subunit protein mS38 n=1 Tax=Raphidocelis subcapitata TaxID=307507 RepID=A0A2V0NJE3_9CHLO|nr:hypothetical protein Rsub_00039 [Raphidocelis subcapitata]|eukprot:GBF87328.1 hypothetical protein Rsub_00039 [Raphidocelis subcapitata]
MARRQLLGVLLGARPRTASFAPFAGVSGSGNQAVASIWPAQQLAQQLGACGAAAAAAAAPGACSGRAYSSWEWPSPHRAQLHSDILQARSMMPHRGAFVPQFSAHGFQLVPESLLSPLGGGAAAAEAALDARAAAAAAGGGEQQQQQQQQQQWRDDSGSGSDGGAMYADSVKRKRVKKMAKHKLRKRRKLERTYDSKK